MTTTENSQPLLDMHRVLVAIRRRRRLWLSTAIVGLIAGAFLSFLIPTPPSAVTRLLVLHSEDQPSDSGTLIKTDVAVLETSRIAGAALKTLNSTEPPEQFVQDYKGAGLTNNIMELTVTATSYDQAVARAQALADAFIADHRQRMQTVADAESQALLGQRDQIQAELNDVDAQIAAAAGRNSQVGPAELQSLYARRADLTSRVSDFTNRANEAKIGTPQLAAGTQIVDAPRAVRASLISSAATSGAIGLGFGLVAGLVLSAVLSVVRDRPVLRRDVSANLGASVIAQLPAPAKFWLRSRAAGDRKRAAATLARAVTNEAGTVSVLELGCPRAAAGLALAMAEELAATGPIVLIDDLPHRELAGMAKPAGKSVQVVDGSERVPEGERRVGVGSLAPGTAWTDLRRLGAETVLIVRAGKASTLWLHTVARQLADLEIPIIGVVLVAPDPRDRTDGTLWDGLHTALRGRAGLRTAVTVRTNGEQPTKAFAPVSPRAGAAPTVTLKPVMVPRSHDPKGLTGLPTRQFTPVQSPADNPEAIVNGKLPGNHGSKG